MSMIRKALKGLGRLVAGDYEIYWILRSAAPSVLAPSEPAGTKALVSLRSASADQLRAARSEVLREQGWYGGSDACVFIAEHQGEPVGMCCYWYGERYRARGFWPLKSAEAKLVQVVVDPSWRGRGIAAGLISYSTEAMERAGFTRLYARVWHSNAPSLRAFKRAGWSKTALVIHFSPFGSKRGRRVVILLDLAYRARAAAGEKRA